MPSPSLNDQEQNYTNSWELELREALQEIADTATIYGADQLPHEEKE